MNRLSTLSLLTLAGALSLPATPLTFTGSDSSGRSASVSFDISGNQLLVTLTNTATPLTAGASVVPTDILTAVFFNIPGVASLNRVSATVTSGSYIVGCTGVGCGSVTNVGGEWAYAAGLSQYSANMGISSTGVGLFGSGDLFDINPSSNLQGPASPDGVQYGIAPAGYTNAMGNGGLSGNGIIVKSVSFALSGLPTNFSTSSISNVTFQYGTALNEPSVPGTPGGGGGQVPEPATLGAMGAGLVALALFKRRQNA